MRFSRREALGRGAGLAVLAAVAAASWLLATLARQDIAQGPDLQAGAPTTRVVGGRLWVSSRSGLPRFKIESPDIIQQADGVLVLARPQLRGQRTDGGRPVRIDAKKAVVNKEQTVAELTGDVELEQLPIDGKASTIIRTQALTVDLVTGSAKTALPVRVDQGVRVLTGVGLRYENASEEVEILSEVQVELPSR